MISEEHIWKIYESHFKQNGIARHQMESFNDFIDNGISRVLREEPDIVIKRPDMIYRVTFSDPYVSAPSVMEEGLDLRQDRDPSECRLRDLTYESTINVTVTESIQEAIDPISDEEFNLLMDKPYWVQIAENFPYSAESLRAKVDEIEIEHKTKKLKYKKPVVKVHTRIPLAKIPMMLRSNKCKLSKYTAQERIEHGEDSWDQGGHFLIRGKERVLVAQTRKNYNTVIVKKGKPDSKLKYIAEIRSMSEETGHSVNITASIAEDNNLLTFTIPYIKEQIPMGVVFKALGVDTAEELIDIIGLYTTKATRYIRTIIRDGFRANVRTQEDAVVFISKNCIQTNTKESDRPAYAWQVIESELFPHMGVTATRKEKLYFLGYIVKKLLLVQLGVKQVDNRDDYKIKRVDPSGDLIMGLFRTLYKQYITQIKQSLSKKKQSLDICAEMKRTNKITSSLNYAFSTGNWNVQKSNYKRVGVSQILQRFYGASLSHLRRVMVPDGKDSKSKEMRQLHPSQCMYMCPWECFDPETPVLMWDGTIKKAGDIVVGDYLIDDNGQATRVRSTCSGNAIMFDVKQHKRNSMDYTVTANHILTLKIREYKILRRKRGKYELRWFDKENLKLKYKSFETREEGDLFSKELGDDNTIDIELYKYLQIPKNTRAYLVGYHTDNIDWPEQPVKLDPYIYGMQLAKLFHGQTTDKPIPQEYIVNSRANRLQVLAGIIDNLGNVIEDENYGVKVRIYFEHTDARINGIQLIAQSLGFSCQIIKRRLCLKVDIDEKIYTTYSNLFITGDLEQIPTRLGKLLLSKCKNKHVESPISVTGKGIGPFVGWQLEGNGRFLLSDATVVHNTPEGHAVGVVLSMALMTRMSVRIPTVQIKDVVERMTTIISVDDFEGKNEDTKVFVNGTLMGFADPEDFIAEFKMLRSQGAFGKDVSIGLNDIEWDREINIYSDEGRMMRPVFNVKNDALSLTTKMGTNWNKLVDKGVISYIDHSESNDSVCAFDQKELKQFKCDYYEHPAMMTGVMAATIPFPMHSPSPRVCYQCLHPDTLVVMHDKSRKAIKDIKIGDSVISVDPNTYETSITRVVNQFVKSTEKIIIKITTESGRSITCTEDHPVLTSKGWQTARDAEDICVIPNWNREVRGNAIFPRISSKVIIENSLIADITTESENHSFLVDDGLCVHNSSMGKQAVGCYALSHGVRSDTVVHTLDYPQRPIVNTKTAELMGFGEMPSGVNAIVAIMTYGGNNQEDSVIINHSAIERGLLCANTWRTHTEETKREAAQRISQIGLPPVNKRRKDWNYSLLDENGIIRKRVPKESVFTYHNADGSKHTETYMYNQQVRVQKGDVIIGKYLTITDKNKTLEEITDCSLAIKKGEEGVIERIYESVASTGYKLVKITIRTDKTPEIGDKVAARSAQKGVIGMVFSQEDMPFTREGIVPDIIINPHALPSRMTINQVMESLVGKTCCLNGEYGDATAFAKPSNMIQEMEKALEAGGFSPYGADETDRTEWGRYGYESMINGQTGKMFQAKIYMGPTFYQRLKHFVSDKEHARARGPLNTLYRQPLDGRARDGGHFKLRPQCYLIVVLV